METDRLVAALEEAGLSSYQAAVYVAVLELDGGAATDVAEASGVPDARVYDVLRDLADRGYVELYEQDAMRARAVEPSVVVEELGDRATRLEAAADEVETRWSAPALEANAVTVVRRFETVEEEARTFVDEAEVQVTATLTPDQFEAFRDHLAAAHDRGVTVDVSLLLDEDVADPDPADFDGVCRTVRRRPRQSPFVVTADCRRTAFAPNPSTADEYGVVLANRSFTYVFFWYFLCFAWFPWPTVYDAGRDRTPVRYADVRQFLLEYGALLRDGAQVTVDVDGRAASGGQRRSVSGRVVDVGRDPVDPSAGGGDSQNRLGTDVFALAGTASFVVDDGDERVTVGGWGAAREDLAARRITVTDVREASR